MIYKLYKILYWFINKVYEQSIKKNFSFNVIYTDYMQLFPKELKTIEFNS